MNKDRHRIKYVWIAVELKNEYPRIVGVYETENKAQNAYKNTSEWINIIKKEIQ